MIVTIADMAIRVGQSKIDPYGYEKVALQCDVCYCRIICRAYPDRWRYFLQLILKGSPPVKPWQRLGTGNAGMDIGPQTNAIWSKMSILFTKLAVGHRNFRTRCRI